MRFSKLSEYFERLEKTSSRLAMTEILAEVFEKADEEEIGPLVHMSLGQLRPKFDKLEFMLAEKMVLRAVALVSLASLDEIKAKFKELGDVGNVVEAVGQTVVESELSVREVYERLVKIATEEGQGSQERKVGGLAELVRELDARSAKFVMRMIVGKLRLGFSDMTVLDALSWMETGGKGKRKQLELAYQKYSDVGEIARLCKQVGADKVEATVQIRVGVPVVPALAQRLKTAKEMIEKMGKVAVEPKFDGTRVQIHFDRSGKSFRQTQGDSLFDQGSKQQTVKTFTRNLDETTPMFPELDRLVDELDCESVILDCEAVGWDRNTGKMLPFQETIKRKRIHGVSEAVKAIPLKFWVFDVLYLNGESLIDKPFHERRKLLESQVKKSELIETDEMVVTDDPKVLREYHAAQLALGLEGVVVKKWDGVYEPGRRGWSWVKFKEAEESKAKLSDTIDAVVMGLYRGKGKRVGFGVGAFLIGVRVEGSENGFEEGKFYTISKVGTGLSDEQWGELKTRAEQYEVGEQPKEYEVEKNLAPDVWLSPGLVVEVAADEVTKSPIHTAGVALRFPRLVRFRDDKGVEQITSIGELEGI